MLNDFLLMQLAKEERKVRELRGAQERLARLALRKPGLACRVCEQLADLLLLAGGRLKALASRMKPPGDLPAPEMR